MIWPPLIITIIIVVEAVMVKLIKYRNNFAVEALNTHSSALLTIYMALGNLRFD